MARCIAQARNDHISTFGLKVDVNIMFLDPDFLQEAKNFRNSATNKGYIAYFLLRVCKTAEFPCPV